MKSDLYYIQNVNYDEHDMIWWAEKGKGFTSSLDHADIFTEEEALKILHGKDNESDIMWPVSYIQPLATRSVCCSCVVVSFFAPHPPTTRSANTNLSVYTKLLRVRCRIGSFSRILPQT